MPVKEKHKKGRAVMNVLKAREKRPKHGVQISGSRYSTRDSTPHETVVPQTSSQRDLTCYFFPFSALICGTNTRATHLFREELKTNAQDSNL